MFRTSRPHLQGAFAELKGVLGAKIPELKAKIKTLKETMDDKVLDPSTVGSSYGGIRGVTALVYEPSLLDPVEGIRFRGYTIPECQEKLPKWTNGTEMMPEAMLWLLLTGEVPTEAQAHGLSHEMYERATNNPALTKEVETVINSLPLGLHPMSQFAIAILTLQKDSVFAKAYGNVDKTRLWEPALEDTLNCMSRITHAAALIYNRTFRGENGVPAASASRDWSGNFAHQMGYTDEAFIDLLRLYLAIHSDHEGGNVSAHTTTLVGSALSDPYLSYAGGMTGLAGPLHGLANQEVLLYLRDLRARMEAKGVTMASPEDAIKKTLTEATWDLLNSGQVVPGYGHAVLIKTDPRYTCQAEFAARHFPDDDMCRLVRMVYETMPGILTEHGKVRNPFPNVDAHSGALLTAFNMNEMEFYTVLFGVSRGLGVLPALVWDRATGKPIERPKSITTEALWEKYGPI